MSGGIYCSGIEEGVLVLIRFGICGVLRCIVLGVRLGLWSDVCLINLHLLRWISDYLLYRA